MYYCIKQYSAAVKPQNQGECSLCDKSVKFGGDTEYTMLNLFRMGTTQIYSHEVDYLRTCKKLTVK